MSTLIPFGKDLKTGLLVDVEDVPRGRACDCVCPSCGLSLVARRGEKNTWHFAHDCRASDEAQKDCDLSFEAVCAQMTRQILLDTQNASFALPYYVKPIFTDSASQIPNESIIITRPSSPTIESVKEFNGPYSLIAKIRNFGMLLDIEHSKRFGAKLDSYPEDISGHIALNLAGFKEIYDKGEIKGRGFKHVLISLIYQGLSGKRWLYHVRELKKIADATKALDAQKKEKIDQAATVRPIGRKSRSVMVGDVGRLGRSVSVGPIMSKLGENDASESGRRKLEASQILHTRCCIQCKRQYVVEHCPYCHR